MSAPTFGWRADLLEFLGRQRARLREDVLGHGELADVVQQRRGLDALHVVVRHPHRSGDRGGVELDPPDVRLRRLILGVDRERERFDRGQVQIGHLAHVALLVFDPSEIDLVGAIRQVERGGRERRDPVRREAAHHQGGHRRRTGADEVARRAPQEVLVPNPQDRLRGGQRDCRRDRQRVDDEVHRGGTDERLGEREKRDRAGDPAEQMIGRAGRLHGDHEARHAEQRPVQRVPLFDPERALAVRARRRDDHRFVRAEQQQRRKVDGVRDRHRRSASRERQVHLEDRGERRQHQEQAEQPQPPRCLDRVGRQVR